MEDVLFISRQRSGSSVLGRLLTDNGLPAPAEALTPAHVKPKQRARKLYSFVSFCEHANISARAIIEQPDAVLDEYFEYVKALLGADRIALTAKSNNLFIIPGPAYVPPARPTLIKYAIRNRLRVVSLTRRNLFNQALSSQVASLRKISHLPTDKIIESDHRDSEISSPLTLQLNVRKAHLQMDNSEATRELLNSWFKGYPHYAELFYEDIFDQHNGGLLANSKEMLQNAFGLEIVNTELKFKKLVPAGSAKIENIAEVREYFRHTPYAESIEELVA